VRRGPARTIALLAGVLCAIAACTEQAAPSEQPAPATPKAPSAPVTLAPKPATTVAPAPPATFPSLFLGRDDTPQRAALQSGTVKAIEKGKGGRTLAFKITLEDGTVGYFKPEQTFSGSHWYAELAAYYLDRELGFGRAPPAVGRVLPWAPLKAAAGNDERLSEIVIGEDGTVRGAFLWWIPGKLERVPMGQGWEKWVRVNAHLHISPYQRPQEWIDDRNAGRATHPWPAPAGEPDTAERPAELSDMILFDYLTTNVDRWGGENTNVRSLEPKGPLLFFDNGAGFTPGDPRLPLTDARLDALERFRPSTRARIAGLDSARLRARMATDPLAPVLTDKQLEHLEIRRQHLLEYTADLENRFGERAHFAEAPSAR
jgi:hypothetical protein